MQSARCRGIWSQDEIIKAVKYPFSKETREIVKWLNFDLSNIDPAVLERAKQRAIAGVESGIVIPDIKSNSQKVLLTELLAHPVAKILVSLTGDAFLMRRYANAEANALRKNLRKESDEFLFSLAKDFGVSVDGWQVDFVDYANRVQGDEFALVNMPLEKGRVRVSKDALVDLLSESLRQKLVFDLSKRVDVPDLYSTFAAEIKKEVNRERASFQETNFGVVENDLFPPCMKSLVEMMQSGQATAHQPRFVLSSFLVNVGMATDQIVSIFQNTPNFNENKTRYYVEYSAGKRGSGTKYSPPSCEKMQYYGLCVSKDGLCDRVKHPLSYYSAKKRYGPKQRGEKRGQ